MQIELIEEGPLDEDARWLKSKALGRRYQLFSQYGRPHRLDLFDNHNTRVMTHEKECEDNEEARRWARYVFVSYLMEQGCLPRGGVFFE